MQKLHLKIDAAIYNYCKLLTIAVDEDEQHSKNLGKFDV